MFSYFKIFYDHFKILCDYCERYRDSEVHEDIWDKLGPL